MSDSVLVVNPGTQPELQRMAEELSHRNRLNAYVTSYSLGNDPRLLQILERIMPRSRPMEDLARRTLAIPGKSVKRAGTAHEAIFMYLLRAGRLPGARRNLLDARNRTVQNRAIPLLATSSTVVGRSTSASRIFGEARRRGVSTLLDYPIAHHRWVNRLLAEECSMFPGLTPMIQRDMASHDQTLLLDAELALADRILVFNEFHAATFTDSGIDPERLVRAPLGVDLDLFRPQAKSPERMISNRFRVVFAGQITPRKGVHYAVEAFKRAAIKNSELLLVGRSNHGMASVLVDSTVRHVQHVPRQRLPEIYAECDVFLFPSLVEGFAQTPIEAMASGLPTIVSPNAVGASFLRHGEEGFVVDPRDVAGIAEILRHLHADASLREAISRRALTRAQEFDWAGAAIRLADASSGTSHQQTLLARSVGPATRGET